MDSAETQTLEATASSQAPKSSRDCRRTQSLRFRHIGPNDDEIGAMLAAVGFENLADFIAATVPKDIRLTTALDLPAGKSEQEALAELRTLAQQNKVVRSFIGRRLFGLCRSAGDSAQHFGKSGWYTAYTPYQAEIAQGASSAAQFSDHDHRSYRARHCERVAPRRSDRRSRSDGALSRGRFRARDVFVSETCHPQTIEVVQTRAKPLGIQSRLVIPRLFRLTRRSSVRCCNIRHGWRRYRLRPFIKKVHEAARSPLSRPIFLPSPFCVRRARWARMSRLATRSVSEFR
jgi:glycine dehydrogenase